MAGVAQEKSRWMTAPKRTFVTRIPTATMLPLSRGPETRKPQGVEMKKGFLLVFSALLMTAWTHSQSPAPPVELKHFSVNSLEGVRATTGANFDRQISSDGNGSIRVDAPGP